MAAERSFFSRRIGFANFFIVWLDYRSKLENKMKYSIVAVAQPYFFSILAIFGSINAFAAVSLLSGLLPPLAWAEAQAAEHFHVKENQSEVLRIGDSEISPNQVVLKEGGGSVFFLNSSKNNEFKIAINYGKKFAHCATGGMKMGEDGIFRSEKAIAPTEFLVVCFPKSGNYPVTFTSAQGRKSQASIKVKNDDE
jgi:hypothetical protein